MTTESETPTRDVGSTVPTADNTPPPMAPLAFLRWCWRQLTSMRTALILLFLLALGAVPGSVIPQEQVDSVRASQWQAQHTTLTPIYQKLGLFDVFGSVWFAAIYLLLMVSLVGCIVPRSRVYWRALRSKPPRTPRNLTRLPEHTSFETDRPAADVLVQARRALRGFRLRAEVDGDDGISAERGYLREAGNLLFHLSVLVVLVGVGVGTLFGYKGGVVVVTGSSFSNTLSQYDDFAPGSLFNADRLSPFRFTVDDFDVSFIRTGREAGSAHKFSAGLTYRTRPGAADRKTRISVNHPLKIDGTSVYLLSHGYAPHITVRDGKGEVAYSGPVVFLPEDATFRSSGVVKVPDATAADGKAEQLGFEGEFYPTYATQNRLPFSAFPDARNPVVSLQVYRGDLGVDTGGAQSLYRLDKKHLTALKTSAGKPLRVTIGEGQTSRLPAGMGTVTFDGLSRYVKVQVSRSPGDWLALLGVCLALLGLLGSLFIRPRRIWVRARSVGGRTLVEVAGLDRKTGGDLAGEVDRLADRLGREKPADEAKQDSEGDVVVSHDHYELISNQAVAACAVVYFLACLANLAAWAAGRKVTTTVSTTSRVAVGAGGPDDAPPETSQETGVGDSDRVDLFRRVGVALTVVGAAVQFVAVAGRGLAADPVRVPWSNMYEFTLTATWVVVVAYLLLYKRFGLDWLSPIVTAFVLITLMLDALILYTPVVPLRDALQSPWLVIHVVAAIIATGALTLGGMTSALYLIKERWPHTRPGGYLDRLPGLDALDRFAYRTHAFAFPIWTFAALIAGPIWAQHAWGKYWGWDPKEVWAFITWVVYAAYLHARATAGWKGKAAAIIALIGLATLWFNFVGINFFFGSGSMHSYA